MILLLLLPFAGPDKPPEKPAVVEIEGHYACLGKVGEAEYAGYVVIAKRGEVYVVSWALPGSATIGIAIREGNKLAVGCRGLDGVIGTVLYAIERDEAGNPGLAGKWAGLPGDGKQYSEQLRFLKR